MNRSKIALVCPFNILNTHPDQTVTSAEQMPNEGPSLLPSLPRFILTCDPLVTGKCPNCGIIRAYGDDSKGDESDPTKCVSYPIPENFQHFHH